MGDTTAKRMKSFYLLACRLGQSLDASHRDAATFFKSLRGVEQRSTTLTLCGAASGKVQRTGRIRPTGGSPGSGSLAAPPPRDTQLMLHRTMACGWAAGRPGLRPMRCAPCGLAPGFLSRAAPVQGRGTLSHTPLLGCRLGRPLGNVPPGRYGPLKRWTKLFFRSAPRARQKGQLSLSLLPMG